jgi:hypothetical protein
MNNGNFSFADVWDQQREEENSSPTEQTQPTANEYADSKNENERVIEIGKKVNAFAIYTRTIVDDEGNDIKEGKINDARSLIIELNKQLKYITKIKNIVQEEKNKKSIDANMNELTDIKKDLDERLAKLESFGGKSRKRNKRSKSSKKKSRKNKKYRRSIKKR